MAFVTGDTGHTVALVGTHLDEAIIQKQSSEFREPLLEELQNGRLGRPSYFGLPKSPARISAVHDEIASGEITARIGCKINHGGRALARLAEAAHRREF